MAHRFKITPITRLKRQAHLEERTEKRIPVRRIRVVRTTPTHTRRQRNAINQVERTAEHMTRIQTCAFKVSPVTRRVTIFVPQCATILSGLTRIPTYRGLRFVEEIRDIKDLFGQRIQAELRQTARAAVKTVQRPPHRKRRNPCVFAMFIVRNTDRLRMIAHREFLKVRAELRVTHIFAFNRDKVTRRDIHTITEANRVTIIIVRALPVGIFRIKILISLRNISRNTTLVNCIITKKTAHRAPRQFLTHGHAMLTAQINCRLAIQQRIFFFATCNRIDITRQQIGAPLRREARHKTPSVVRVQITIVVRSPQHRDAAQMKDRVTQFDEFLRLVTCRTRHIPVPCTLFVGTSRNRCIARIRHTIFITCNTIGQNRHRTQTQQARTNQALPRLMVEVNRIAMPRATRLRRQINVSLGVNITTLVIIRGTITGERNIREGHQDIAIQHRQTRLLVGRHLIRIHVNITCAVQLGHAEAHLLKGFRRIRLSLRFCSRQRRHTKQSFQQPRHPFPAFTRGQAEMILKGVLKHNTTFRFRLNDFPRRHKGPYHLDRE